jgi:hypothetical protein
MEDLCGKHGQDWNNTDKMNSEKNDPHICES